MRIVCRLSTVNWKTFIWRDLYRAVNDQWRRRHCVFVYIDSVLGCISHTLARTHHRLGFHWNARQMNSPLSRARQHSTANCGLPCSRSVYQFQLVVWAHTCFHFVFITLDSGGIIQNANVFN